MTHRPIDTVLSKLRKVKPNGENSWLACCPAHDDRNPSLSVSVGDDGRVLLHCFAGCSSDAVRATLGLEWRHLYVEPIGAANARTRTPRAAHAPPRADAAPAVTDAPTGRVLGSLDEARVAYRRQLGEPSASWIYRDAGGEPIGEVFRWDTPNGKTIRPAFLIDGGWRMTYPSVRPLYGLNRIGTEPRVFVVEGEKAAERLHALGYPAITSPGGSKAADRADWSPLAAREVVILPDADESGRRYADAVADLVRAEGAEVGIARLDGLRFGSGDDIVEWIDEVHAGDETEAARDLEAIADEARWSERRRRPVLTVADILADPAWSRPPEVLRSGVAWWDDIQPFGGIERGSLVVLAAPPRCYKTSVMLFLGWKYAAAGHRVHYLAGEMTRPALVRRIVSMAGEVSPSVVMEPETEDESRRVAAAVKRVASLDDHLTLGRAPITVEQIDASADDADIVVVDYLQLIRPEASDAAGGRAEELEGTMNALLGVIQRGGTVIAAAALNRSGRDTPSLTSIRGSSAIEYGATTVYATVERLVGLDPDAKRDDPAVVYECLKQREGEAIDLRFGIEPRLGPLPVAPPDRWA